jgi:hypothetical protein
MGKEGERDEEKQREGERQTELMGQCAVCDAGGGGEKMMSCHRQTYAVIGVRERCTGDGGER